MSNPTMNIAEIQVRPGADQYRATVAAHRLNISDEERAELVERARQGDQEARQAITMVMFGLVAAFAHRTSTAYDWASPRLEYEELAQIGMLAVVERLDAALMVSSPYGYLAKSAMQNITNYCYQYVGLIRRPRRGSSKEVELPVLPVSSLDAARGETGLTLSDTLASPPEESAPARDYSPLYAAMEQLTEKQQEVIRRYYGLGGCAPETLYAIEKPGGIKARAVHKRATLALAKWLQGTTPAYGRAV